MSIFDLLHKNNKIKIIVAILLLIAGGCIKYCTKASSVTQENIETRKEAAPKKEEAPKPPKIPEYHLSDKVLKDLPPGLADNFHGVFLMDNVMRASLLNNETIEIRFIADLTGQPTIEGPETLFIRDVDPNSIVLGNKSVECALDGLGKDWYLDWDNVKNTFHPLQIKINDDLKGSASIQKILSSALATCNIRSVTTVQSKISPYPNKLREMLEKFLQDSDIKIIDDTVKQRLAFLSPGSIEGTFIVFYLKDNNYGKFISQKKIAFTKESGQMLVQESDVIKKLSKVFLLESSVLTLSDLTFGKSIETVMTHRKGVSGLLSVKERDMVINAIAGNFLKKFSE